MTFIAIVLFAMLMFFWFTYNKSRKAFDVATKKINESISCNDEYMSAIKNQLLTTGTSMSALINLNKSQDNLINSISNLSIQQRILIIQILNPSIKVSQDYVYRIDDLRAMLNDNEITHQDYFLRFNDILEEIHPLN